MAKANDNKSVLSQLQSVGEDAIGRITKSPAARSALEKGSQLKDRAGKTLSGFEGIEDRLKSIEKRSSTRSRSTSTSRSTKSSSTKSTTAKPRSSSTQTKS
jgi:hypothetical protein